MTDQDPGRESIVEEVTVYRDGARVVRSVTTRLSPGLQTMVLLALPATADPESVRIASRSAGVAIVDVEVERRHGAEAPAHKARALEERLEACRLRLQEIADEDAGEAARLQYLSHLSQSAATSLARAVALGRMDPDELWAMEAHLAQSTTEALARRRQILARKVPAERELQAAEAALRDLTRTWTSETAPVESCEVRATVEAAGAPETAFEVAFEVAYHVAQASWRPLYDIRVAAERLAVSYLAELTQRSGEDWPETRLVLSTTRRGAHEALPELATWFIGLQRAFAASALRPRGGSFRATALGAAPFAAAPAGAAEAPPPMPQAAGETPPPAPPPLVSEVDEGGSAMTYRVPRPVAIASDGAPRKVAVAELELEAELDYLAVPALATEAYLRATAVNTSPVVLLPGPGQVFHDGEFVGRTELDTVAPGEEFELQLGIDERIRLERELAHRRASKTLIGSTRKLDIGYELTVENHRALPARVSLHDHIPVSRDGEVKVRLGEVDPQPDEQDDLGELTWELALEPGGKTKVRYAFTVEYPAGAPIYGI